MPQGPSINTRTRFAGAFEFRLRETPRRLRGSGSDVFVSPHMQHTQRVSGKEDVEATDLVGGLQGAVSATTVASKAKPTHVLLRNALKHWSRSRCRIKACW